MRVIVVNGCFDLIHMGHIRLLEFAKEQGDYLIVLVNSDKSIYLSKGEERPVISCDERLNMLRALRCVDAAVEFDTEEELMELLKKFKPQAMVKGMSYRGKHITGEHLVEEVIFYPETPHSTTGTVERIKHGQGAYVRRY